MKTQIEVYLGNWGTMVCFNDQHKDYLIAAKSLRDVRQAISSWIGAWLSKEQQSDYLKAESEAKSKCESLFAAIPDKTNDLRKNH